MSEKNDEFFNKGVDFAEGMTTWQTAELQSFIDGVLEVFERSSMRDSSMAGHFRQMRDSPSGAADILSLLPR